MNTKTNPVDVSNLEKACREKHLPSGEKAHTFFRNKRKSEEIEILTKLQHLVYGKAYKCDFYQVEAKLETTWTGYRFPFRIYKRKINIEKEEC